MFQPTETGDWDNLLPQRIFYSPPVGCRHVRPARQLGVNLPKAAGRNHKKYPRFQVEIGDISFHLFPQVAGPCVSSVRCDTMRYLADGNSTLQNNLLAYSHSFTPICCGVIQVNSSWAVGLDCLAAESRRVTSRRRLGQILGQNRKLFRNRKPAVSFLSRGQKRVGFEALKRPI